jgi:hypothetical protein
VIRPKQAVDRSRRRIGRPFLKWSTGKTGNRDVQISLLFRF